MEDEGQEDEQEGEEEKEEVVQADDVQATPHVDKKPVSPDGEKTGRTSRTDEESVEQVTGVRSIAGREAAIPGNSKSEHAAAGGDVQTLPAGILDVRLSYLTHQETR